MRRAGALGLAGKTRADTPLLGEVPRGAADIQTAVGRLTNPSQRLSDRLFWFHQPPQQEEAAEAAIASEVIAPTLRGVADIHDEALRGLCAAFQTDLDASGAALWVHALRVWHDLVLHDDYWALTMALEKRGGFEPAALPSELDALRADAVHLAAEALVVSGRDALARNQTAAVRRIVVALEQLDDTGPWAKSARDEILSPALERFHALCRSVREECGSGIVRKEDAAGRNKIACDAALERYQREVTPALDEVMRLLPARHEAAQNSREEAALCLTGIATDYTWADDFIASEGLHEEALKLAQDAVGAIRIQHGLAQIRESARKQRVFGLLKPISSAPSLSTVNGSGFTLYGRSDYDSDTHSYAATRYFVILFIPIVPVGRYRVINMGGNRYRFLGKLPLRKGDLWHLGVAAAAVLLIILNIMITSGKNSGSSYSPSKGTGYRSTVQSNNYSRQSLLSDLKARIDAGRARLNMLESQLQPVTDELGSLNARMETLASELKSLDRQHTAGLRIDTDDYNAKVVTYNALLSRHRALLAANSSDFQLYKELAQQDKDLVAQYNALLR
jgi:hypothetical protein